MTASSSRTTAGRMSRSFSSGTTTETKITTSVDTAFDLLVDLPNVEVPRAPDQAVLDAIVSELPAA